YTCTRELPAWTLSSYRGGGLITGKAKSCTYCDLHLQTCLLVAVRAGQVGSGLSAIELVYDRFLYLYPLAGLVLIILPVIEPNLVPEAEDLHVRTIAITGIGGVLISKISGRHGPQIPPGVDLHRGRNAVHHVPQALGLRGLAICIGIVVGA